MRLLDLEFSMLKHMSVCCHKVIFKQRSRIAQKQSGGKPQDGVKPEIVSEELLIEQKTGRDTMKMTDKLSMCCRAHFWCGLA